MILSLKDSWLARKVIIYLAGKNPHKKRGASEDAPHNHSRQVFTSRTVRKCQFSRSSLHYSRMGHFVLSPGQC